MNMRMALVVATLVMLGLATHSRAEIITRDITYTHGEQKLVGYLAYDDAVEGKRPGVLVVHEWWGLNDYAKRRARMLAEMGYVAFCADMYGPGKVTADPKQAGQWAGHLSGDIEQWRQRALAGLGVLKEQPQTDTTDLAAIGYCFGGSTVIHLAYANPPGLKAVASFHGGLPIADEKVKQVKPEILICHGEADDFVKPDHISKFKAALDRADAKWTFVSYADAVHSFTNPQADDHGIEGIGYNARADRQSWAHMKMLLEQVFAADGVGLRIDIDGEGVIRIAGKVVTVEQIAKHVAPAKRSGEPVVVATDRKTKLRAVTRVIDALKTADVEVEIAVRPLLEGE